MHILKSKIAIVVCGALLIGTVSGALAAFSAAQPSTAAPAPSLAQASSTASPTTGASATSTATRGPATPNPTAVPSPTRTPCSTPTPAPSNTQVSAHGRVESVDQTNSLFVMRIYCGGTMTVHVGSTTTWPGQIKSLSALQPDMQADVQGTSLGNYALTASSVDAQIDN